jgi:DNA ligase-1
MLVKIDWQSMTRWLKKYCPKMTACPKDSTLEHEMFALRGWDGWDDKIYILKQTILPTDEVEAAAELGRHMDHYLEAGGEGVIIRNPASLWTPKRVGDVLKFKPWEDDEGIVVGFTSGRLTDKGSKHLGKIGAIILHYKGKRLELSGLTDAEREFSSGVQCDYAKAHPGEDMPNHFSGIHFKLGQKVTFKYRELSDDGIPKEARYWRVRGEE